MVLFSQRTGLIDTESAFKIGPQIRFLEDQGKRVIKCNLGEPDFPLPQHIKDEVKRQIDLDNTHYCDPGDEVVYPSPAFPIYESFINYVGAKPVPIHLQEEKNFSLSGQELAPFLSKNTKLIFINFPSNPTGGVASKDQLQGIAEAINKKCSGDIRIYSDEVYEHILFDGTEHQSIISFPGMEKKTVLVSGASKSFSWTGGRIGWALFPTVEEAEIFKNLNINYFSCTAPYNQEGVRLGLESPLSRGSIQKMVKTFQERRDLVVNGLNAIKGIGCQNPKGAFYVFPNIRGVCDQLGIFDAYRNLPSDIQRKTTPSTLFQMFLLFEHQVATLDRKSFGRIGIEDLHFLRLSIATDTESLKEGVKRIAAAAQDSQGFKAFLKKGEHLY